MQYWKTLPAIFLSRPNRFIAVCQLGEETVTVHVKNTGRCAELRIVFLLFFGKSSRVSEFSIASATPCILHYLT